MQEEKRFLDRIWMKIFRDKTTCSCNTCKEVEENWLIVHDKSHAKYLYTVQCDYMAEWKALNYRDVK